MRQNLLMVRGQDVDVAVTAVKMTHEQLDALETLIDEKARERHFDATQSMLQMTVGTVVSVYAHIHVVLSLAVFFDQTWVFNALRQIATRFEDDRWITAGLQLIGLPYWGRGLRRTTGQLKGRRVMARRRPVESPHRVGHADAELVHELPTPSRTTRAGNCIACASPPTTGSCTTR